MPSVSQSGRVRREMIANGNEPQWQRCGQLQKYSQPRRLWHCTATSCRPGWPLEFPHCRHSRVDFWQAFGLWNRTVSGYVGAGAPANFGRWRLLVPRGHLTDFISLEPPWLLCVLPCAALRVDSQMDRTSEIS